MYVSLPLLPAAYLYSDCAYRVFKAIMRVVERLRLRAAGYGGRMERKRGSICEEQTVALLSAIGY